MKNSITRSNLLGATIPAVMALFSVALVMPALGDVNIDFNTGNGGFTSSFNTTAFDGPWVYSATAGVNNTGGWATIGQSANIGHSCTTDLTSSIMTVLSTGNVFLSFDHLYSFEVDSGGRWDGGAIFVSRNGGAYTMVNKASFTANGYNAALTGWGAGSELAGFGDVFSGNSATFFTGAYMTSTANLGSFNAGDTFSIRFRAAFDSNTSAGSPSWAIDNISISNAGVPSPGVMALLTVAGSLAGGRRRA